MKEAFYMKNKLNITSRISTLIVTTLLVAQPLQARWYDAATLKKGDALFQQNCASCHKADASGTVEWKKPDASGHYPPPPLNGTAHAWHHDLELLKQIIRDGGVKLGGVMPSFKDKLSAQEIGAVIAYFQSRWPDAVYDGWQSRNEPGDIPLLDSAIRAGAGK
jgi:mono/diheme cytochrome c family protein